MVYIYFIWRSFLALIRRFISNLATKRNDSVLSAFPNFLTIDFAALSVILFFQDIGGLELFELRGFIGKLKNQIALPGLFRMYT
jgi:hypothetical protein